MRWLLQELAASGGRNAIGAGKHAAAASHHTAGGASGIMTSVSHAAGWVSAVPPIQPGAALCDVPAQHSRRQSTFGHAGIRSSVRHGVQCELRACCERRQQVALRSQQFGLCNCATWGLLGGHTSSLFLVHLL